MNTAQQVLASIGVDIDGLEDTTHRVAVVEDAEGNPVSGFIIVGKNSEEYTQVTGDVRVDNIKRGAKRKTALDTTTDEGAKILLNTITGNEKKIAVAVVVDWFGFTSGGVEIPFDKSRVDGMLTKRPTWQAKITAALEVDANFTKA